MIVNFLFKAPKRIKSSASTKKVKQTQQLQPVRYRERNEIIENKPIPKESKPSASRYPKRGGSRKCYKEQQVPDEDHFLCKFPSFYTLFTKVYL